MVGLPRGVCLLFWCLVGSGGLVDVPKSVRYEHRSGNKAAQTGGSVVVSRAGMVGWDPDRVGVHQIDGL